MKLTSAQKAWIVYDPAISAYAMIVRTVVAPIFLAYHAQGIVSNSGCSALWGYAGSTAGLAAGVISIFTGPRIDAKKKKLLMVAVFTILGIISTLSYIPIPYLPGGTYVPYLILGISFAGMVCFMVCNSFYDALLIDIAGHTERDKISSIGYALGYAGALGSFLLCLPLMNFSGGKYFYAGAFAITAIWWTAGSLPMFIKVRETPTCAAGCNMIKLQDSIKFILTRKNIFIFLIAYFLYIDGVGTIMMQATLIAKGLNLPDTNIMLTILALQVIGLPFTLIFGFLAEKFSAKTMIHVAILIYVIIAIIVTFMSFSGDQSIRKILFYLAAALIGIAQGGIQSLSRSLFSRIIPKERSAELFAVYNLFGKFTTIVGPLLLIPTAVLLWNKAELGITLLLIPFIIGSLLLNKVEVPENC